MVHFPPPRYITRMEDEPRPHDIAGRTYLAQRFIDSETLDGHIELSDPATRRPLARISYHHATQAMDVTMGYVPIPSGAVQWMLDRAETGLRS
jgi:hypothetical protein